MTEYFLLVTHTSQFTQISTEHFKQEQLASPKDSSIEHHIVILHMSSIYF